MGSSARHYMWPSGAVREAGMSRPAVLFWGHEPRATGWTDPDHVAAYMYNNATGEGRPWRVSNVPFIMEAFCMADHGIVSGYRMDNDGVIRPELLSSRNDAAEAWGLKLYRRVLYAFAAALAGSLALSSSDARARYLRSAPEHELIGAPEID